MFWVCPNNMVLQKMLSEKWLHYVVVVLFTFLEEVDCRMEKKQTI